MRAALVQLCSSDDPAANLPVTEALIREAAAAGAELILTPECTNIVTADRERQRTMMTTEADDATLARLRTLAAELGRWIVAGSLLLKSGDADGRLVNRCFVIGPDGAICARYDKIHMFDVDLPNGESYRESRAFRPGGAAVTVEAAGARLGLSICYDLRFPYLYRALAGAGAQILTIPSAFTVPTGRAHWHVLMRARAIETGCFVLASAQSGVHPVVVGRPRLTYGHSLAVSPWGEVIADAGEAIGVTLVTLDPGEVTQARQRIASLDHARDFSGP
jgi:predicted amidohydrolase